MSPSNGRKRSHVGSEMPPPAWPASTEPQQPQSAESPSDEDALPSISKNTHERGSHKSLQGLDHGEAIRSSETQLENHNTHASRSRPTSSNGEWSDTGSNLESMDWEELERRYNSSMEERDKVEEDIYKEFGSLFEFFALWMQVPIDHDSQRSIKRLKTRMFKVQSSEDDLEKKRQHYGKVVEAFKNAMALLDGP